MISFINFTLSSLTVLTQIALVCLFIFAIFSFADLKNIFEKSVSEKNAFLAVFIIALVATGGSLYFSQIVGMTPCELCWFQRIFMYPQTVILAVALIKNDSNKILDYSLALASIGIFISIYHNYIIYSATENKTCLLSAVSCTTKTVIGFGYVTIPVMALTAFASMVAILVLQKIISKK